VTKRRICVITGSRAEYGILQRLIRAIADDPELELQLVATGSHLVPEFGLTYRAIEADGFAIDRKIEIHLASDTALGMAKSVGLGILGFADALDALAPDVVVITGDRFEMLAAAQAAFLTGIAVAHISGGEVTEGAIDDAIRHAITKLAHYHFVAAEPYRRRVIQLGEQPSTVFNVGDPALDNIALLPLLDRESLGRETGIDPRRPYFLVTYHPVTVGGEDPALGMGALISALDGRADHDVLITKPNVDAGGRMLSAMVDAFGAQRPGRVVAATSLGQLHYLSAMKHCAAVVGNSSSGIVEAPALKRPTVNIGPRQHGRLKADSIIDCAPTAPAIADALQRAISREFQAALAGVVSLYGGCDATARIHGLLKQLDLTRHRAKRFHDVAF
jgi:UDP-N-acetylglucosamine 2-epimerase (non-hydrolysing)/GDP/UDP-N,N'-diacetylbacillosamine 2-epimerase (hydrolysing)